MNTHNPARQKAGSRRPPASPNAPTLRRAHGSSQMHSVEHRLRRLLALQVGGVSVYMDDGEISDSSVYPAIDFLRFTPEQIEDALRRRSEAKLLALTKRLKKDAE